MALSELARLVRASEHRKTRFHTERGEMLPLGSLPAAVRSLARRLRGSTVDEGPWIASSATAVLDTVIQPSWAVLELGSGGSTAWLAHRSARVTSLESSPDWAAQTRTVLAMANLHNVELVEVPVDALPGELARRAHEKFDLVTIDCHESDLVSRLDCLSAAAPLVLDGGCLVLDDSDRLQLRPAPDVLVGWHAERHIGMKPFPLMAIETTIFTKPVRHAALSQPMPNRPECAANLQVSPPRPTKVNVGSGGQAVAGWLNVDKSPAVVLARWRRVRRALAFAGVLTDQQRQGFSTDVVYGDATKRLRFSDRSVDFLYCSHMIEHLSREQGMGFLIEVMRILKPGGMIRLATPDLAHLVSQYVADAGCDPSRAGDAFVSRMHFYHQTDGSFLGGLISRYLSGHWHQWLYDNASLSALLNGAGFAEINECQFRQGAFPDLQQIESRADSLFVQATKPLDT